MRLRPTFNDSIAHRPSMYSPHESTALILANVPTRIQTGMQSCGAGSGVRRHKHNVPQNRPLYFQTGKAISAYDMLMRLL